MLRLLITVFCVGSAFSLPYLAKRDSPVQKRPCQEAADLILTLVEDNKEEHAELSNGFSKYDIDIFRFVLGLDVTPTPTAEFEELVCHFFDDSTDDFLQYAHQNGIEQNAIRRLYDWNAMWLELSASHPDYTRPGTAHHKLLNIIDQTGFFNLDMSGIKEATEIFAEYLDQLPPPSPFEVAHSEAPGTCADLEISMLAYWRYLTPREFSDDDIIELACKSFMSENIEELIKAAEDSGLMKIIVVATKNYLQGHIDDLHMFEAYLDKAENNGWETPGALQQRRLIQSILIKFRDALPQAAIHRESDE